MPQTERASRTNFYSSAGKEYDEDREPLDDSKPSHERATESSSNKDEWIAFGILLDGARRYCPNCKQRRESTVELEDKQRAPREHEDGDRVIELPHTSLKWTCDECGYQCFGGILEDRSIPEFLDVVDEVLDSIGGVPESRRRELRGEALGRKRRGVDDRANLTVLLTEL